MIRRQLKRATRERHVDALLPTCWRGEPVVIHLLNGTWPGLTVVASADPGAEEPETKDLVDAIELNAAWPMIIDNLPASPIAFFLPDTPNRIRDLVKALQDCEPAARERKQLSTANALLADYIATPYLVRREDGSVAVQDRAAFVPGQIMLGGELVSANNRPAVEFLAMREIIALFLAGELHRLRQCPGCNCWFFAERKDKRACSTGCRQNVISRTDDFKQHRRRYMRWYLRHESGDTKLTFKQWVNKEQSEEKRYAATKE